MEQKYINKLKEYPNISGDSTLNIEYIYDRNANKVLQDRFHILEIAGSNSDFEKIQNLLKWIHLHIRHVGDYDNSDIQDAIHLLDIAYDNPNNGINCLALSIILAECLLASHIPARVVYMMPYEIEDGDNHVVVEAFWADKNKWIMVDPTYGNWCIGSEESILNLYEIRQYFIEGRDFCFSKDMDYNGKKVLNLEDVKSYYTKNVFFLRCRKHQGYGYHKEFGDWIEIAPSGFDVHDHMVQNIKYRIRYFGEFDIFTKWLSIEKNLNTLYMSAETFYAKPLKILYIN